MTTQLTLVDSQELEDVPLYADLIGVPFKVGGRDLNGLDCYGLVRVMYERAGKEIHDAPSTANPDENNALINLYAVQNWIKTEKKPGVVVLFRVGRYICHVGYLVDNDNFIHSWQGTSGVVKEPLLTWKKRIVGFYEYRSCAADKNNHNPKPS